MTKIKRGLARTIGSLDWMKSNRVAVCLLWLMYLCFYKLFHVVILLKPLVQNYVNVAIFTVGGNHVCEECEVIAYLIKIYQMY